MGEAKRRKKLDPTWGKHPSWEKRERRSFKVRAVDPIKQLKSWDFGVTVHKLSLGDTDAFLEKYGHYLAAFARKGYEDKGRGILVMPGFPLIEGYVYMEICYLTADEVRQLPCLNQAGKTRCKEVIAEYSPDQEAAICLVFENIYEVNRSVGFNPIEQLSTLKREPNFANDAKLIIKDSEDGDCLIFSHELPNNWDNRIFFTLLD